MTVYPYECPQDYLAWGFLFGGFMGVGTLVGNKPGFMVDYGRGHQGDALYKDTGCRLSPTCLECPYPLCYEDSTSIQYRQIERHITFREAQVAKMVSEGMTGKEIAAALSLSSHTVRNQINSAIRKLNLRNRAQLAAKYAAEAAVRCSR